MRAEDAPERALMARLAMSIQGIIWWFGIRCLSLLVQIGLNKYSLYMKCVLFQVWRARWKIRPNWLTFSHLGVVKHALIFVL